MRNTSSVVIHQSCLVKSPDGTEKLYRSFEELYEAGETGSVQLVYCPIDRKGKTPKGMRTWYADLTALIPTIVN